MWAGTTRGSGAGTTGTPVGGVHPSFLAHAARMPSVTAYPNRDSLRGRSPELVGGQEDRML